jgi:Bacteriophage baseplate protein W
MSTVDFNIERKDFLGRGWATPVALDPRTGKVATVAYEDDIRQSMRIRLICTSVEEALQRFEARIDVLNVEVNEDATVQGQLIVEIEYRVRKTNQSGNLVFPFYFREGGQP